MQCLWDIDLNMNGVALDASERIDCLGLGIRSSLSWREHLLSLVAAAARKLGALYRVIRFFTPAQVLKIYKANIRPCIEYCSHVWGGSSSVWVLERVDRRARRLVNDRSLTDSELPLQHRRDVAEQSIFYRMFHGYSSGESGEMIPPLTVRVRRTRAAERAHQYTVDLPRCRVQRYARSFVPRAAHRWNDLAEEVFPENYDPKRFKVNVHNYNQGHA